MRIISISAISEHSCYKVDGIKMKGSDLLNKPAIEIIRLIRSARIEYMPRVYKLEK